MALGDKRGAELITVCSSVHALTAEFEGLLSGDVVDEEQLSPLRRANGKVECQLESR